PPACRSCGRRVPQSRHPRQQRRYDAAEAPARPLAGRLAVGDRRQPDRHVPHGARSCPGNVPRRSASIVNISSIFAQGATTEYPVVSYYASKGGVEGLTKALRGELGPHNIRVNAIAPGFFPSPMSTDMFAESELGQRLRREVLTPRTALPSLPRSADLRGAVRFLAGNESAFVTGHTLVVDG